MLRLFPFSSASRRQRSKVVFLHAPKTGGTTFSRVLQRMYGDSCGFFDDDAADVFVRDLEAYGCTEIHATGFDFRIAFWSGAHGVFPLNAGG